jgi:hypothetical protein
MSSVSQAHAGEVDHLLQRIADGATWLLFRLCRVRIR